ncbi:MAG: hypothetical protein QXI58_02520 [Candidatus Micrarchaeia archaeon]
MVVERVPLLNIRPRHLIKVYSVPSKVPFDAYNMDVSSLINSLSKLDPIGGIQSLTITSTRELNQWRELNYDTLGRVMEVYPSLGTFEVSVERIAFYKNHLLDAFCGPLKDHYSKSNDEKNVSTTFNVYNQIAPIHILVEMPIQEVTTGSDGKTTLSEKIAKVLIYDCWFDKSEIEFNVTDDNLAIVQEATLTAAGITAVIPSQ